MPDINDELEIQEGLTADTVDAAHPEQDHPLQHVPEETLRNLDSLVVDFVQAGDQAETAQRIATEAQEIEASGRIDKLRAEEIAKDVPAVLGTPESPVSYTSVPTAIGVSKAVEIMQNGSAQTKQAAVTKVKELIDRTLGTADSELNANEQTWVSALSSYSLARTGALEKLTALPEDSYEVYIGDQPAPTVLAEVLSPNTEGYPQSPALDKFAKAVSGVLNYGSSSPEVTFFSPEPGVVIGERLFKLDGLNISDSLDATTPFGQVSLTKWLNLPAAKLGSVVTTLRSSASTLTEMLRGYSLALTEDPEMSALDVTKIVQDVVTAASILAAVSKSLKTSSIVTQAAADFYKDMGAGGAPAQVQAKAVEGYRRQVSRLFS